MTNKWLGHIMAFTTISIWSSTFIVSKILLETWTPYQVLLVRYIMAIIFLSMIYPKFHKPTEILEEVLFLVIGAALVAYFIFENSALQRTYSSNVSLIVATIPFMTGFISMLFTKKNFFTIKNVTGFIVSYTGVVLIILNGRQLEGIEPIGDLLAFGAAVMFAIYTVFMQRIKPGYHLIQLTRKVFVYGLVVLIAYILITNQSMTLKVVGPFQVGSLIFLGIIASSLAFIMWNRSIQIIGSIRTNQYIYLVPVVTTGLAAMIINESITLLTIIGTILILLGLYVSEVKIKVRKKTLNEVKL